MENNILEDLKWRYATKKFDPEKKLDQQHIALLSECFNLTATSYGLQPCKMVVVQDDKLQEEMVSSSFGQRQVADSSAVLVIRIQEVDSAYIKKYFDLVKNVRNTPNEVLQPFQDFLVDSFSKKTVDEIETWAKNQAYLILGNLLAVCAAQRIDSCPMEGFEPEKIDELLELSEQGLKSILLLPVGYRAQDDFMADQKKVRKPISESVIKY